MYKENTLRINSNLLIKINKLIFVICLLWLGTSAVAQAAVPNGWWTAIANDQTSDIEAMLQQGVDPNAVDPRGEPSIMLAVRRKAWDVFDVLAADPRTNVNITNRLDETPLMYLAIVGQTDRARALIRRGAEVNRLGWTPLHYAASTGQMDMAKMLLADKAIVNAPGPDGTTPLMMAALSGSDAMVQLLLKAGADPTTRNLKGQTAADWARQKNFTALAGKLDALAEKVLTQRRIRREKDIANKAQAIPVPEPGGGDGAQVPSGPLPAGRPAPGTGYPGTGGQGVVTDMSPPAAAQPARPAAPEAPAQPQGNGTSRYFNLEGPVPDAGH